MRDVAIREIDIASGKAPHPPPLRGGDTVSHEREKKTHALVQIEQVSKAFATAAGAITALDDVSLDIAENEFFTLLGPSGCGKTTLLRLLAGFEHPDAGRVWLDGKSLVEAPPHKRPVNIVFQSYALFPHMSVAQNVAFGLEQQGISRKATRARVDEMLALVRLDAMAARKPAQLSGGQQQRVALARALAPNPKLLLLDEPLSALDVKLRRGMQVELKRIQRETGVTFLLVTHDQEEALSMSDRIAVMNEGRVLQVGAPHDIYEAPRSRFVADFMGANVVPGALVGASCAFAAIRPERIGLAKDGEDGIPGSIEATTYLGAKSAWLVALDDGTRIKVEGDWPRFAAGHSVRCTLPPSALVPLDA